MANERLGIILKEMEQEGVPQLLVTDPSSIYYLIGKWIHPGERLLALYLSTKKAPILFINELFPLDDEVNIDRVWLKDTDNSCEILAKHILGEGILGIDKVWPAGFLLELMKHNNCNYIDSSYIIDRARAIKDSGEIAAMERASGLNDKAMETIIKTLDPNLNELKTTKALLEIYEDLGTDGPSFDPIIAFGKNAADPHHSPDNSTIKEGDSIIIDIGCKFNGYVSDMTRTVFYKSASEEDKEVYETVKTANQLAIDIIKPGVRFCDIDAAARNHIEAKGYGKYFTHRTGHSIGIDVHEAGDVSAVNTARVEAGMIFSIEPGIYLPNKMGVRIEDLVLVTEDGCQVLNSFPKKLMIIE